MSIRIIFGLLVLVLFSCKKDISTFDREDDLVVDTAAVLYSASYISHTATQLNVKINMVVFNGLESENTYTNYEFSGTPPDATKSYNFTNLSVNSLTANNAYSSVFLFNQNNNDWYLRNVIGFYYRRFLEQIETNNNKKTAIASFYGDGPSEVVFYKENPNLYFGNSWQYSLDEFYDFTSIEGTNTLSTATQILFLTQRIDEVIDSITTSSELIGNRSITLFSGRDFDTGENPTNYLNATILKAQSNGIKINLIGPGFNPEVKRLAHETGGFICAISDDDFVSSWYIGNITSAVEVGMQNLDRLLSQNIIVHSCDLIVTATGGPNFQSGDQMNLPINYSNPNINHEYLNQNGFEIAIDFVIP